MVIDDTEVVISGRFLKTARLRNEWYDFVAEPAGFIAKLRQAGVKADLFTFLSEIHQRTPITGFYHEWDSVAVIPITTYENWWKNQISDKSRNMARKAAKKGLEIRVASFDDEFVRGIMEINDESPMRQGRPYWHYRKDFETVKRDNITFLAQTTFLGAYLGVELIGYIKLVHGNGKASIMQILSKMAHRDKAPNNALMAKAVEICAEAKIPLLHYASWSRRGLGDFKISQAFKRFDVPRYYVALSVMGHVALSCRLHRKPANLIPETCRDRLVSWRESWYNLKQQKLKLRAGQ